MSIRVDTSPDSSLRFVVPVYRLPDGRTWVRLGRGLFDENPSPGLGPYGLNEFEVGQGEAGALTPGLSLQTLSWFNGGGWENDFLSKHISTLDDTSHCPVFGLVERGKVLTVWSPDPDNPFFFKIKNRACKNIELSLLGLISDLGAPFDLLQGRIEFDGTTQIPYWIYDEELNAIQEAFSEDPVQVHGDEIEALRERVLDFFGQKNGRARLMNPYSLPQICVTFGGQPELELLISMEFTSAWSTTKKDRVLYTVTFILKDHEDPSRTLVSARSLAKAFRALVGPQGPKGPDGEPLVLSKSDFEVWWDQSILAPASVFDLSMFHLLGVRSPCLLPDAEFVTWVKAMEAS